MLTPFCGRALLAATSFALVFTACGQKGPLVQPDVDASDVVIREAGGVQQSPSPAAKPEPGSRAPRVPAPTQAPSETAPRSTTPK
jgi:predicted small lipoprotein YifL